MNRKTFRPIGTHLLIDIKDADRDLLSDVEKIEDILQKAAEKTEATVIFSHFHHFHDGGVTGVLLLAESHISIHTWPKEGFAAIDIFMCGNLHIEVCIPVLRNEFGNLMKIQRYIRG